MLRKKAEEQKPREAKTKQPPLDNELPAYEPEQSAEFEASAMGQRTPSHHAVNHRRTAARGANRFPDTLPNDGQIVIAQIKGGPLAVVQYRETDEQRRRNDAPDSGPVLAGDFYGSHAGSAEYSTIVGGIESWAPVPDMTMHVGPAA